MAKSNLTLLEKWEDEDCKYILLGDKKTHGAEYAEVLVIFKRKEKADG